MDIDLWQQLRPVFVAVVPASNVNPCWKRMSELFLCEECWVTKQRDYNITTFWISFATLTFIFPNTPIPMIKETCRFAVIIKWINSFAWKWKLLDASLNAWRHEDTKLKETHFLKLLFRRSEPVLCLPLLDECWWCAAAVDVAVELFAGCGLWTDSDREWLALLLLSSSLTSCLKIMPRENSKKEHQSCPNLNSKT